MSRSASAAALAIACGAAIGSYARFVAPRRLTVNEVEIPLDGLPPELDGIRIGVVADTHLGIRHGRVWSCPALPDAIEAVRRSHLDVLALCGDFGYMRWDPAELASAIARFEAPIRVAVLGNHDYARGYKRAAALTSALEAHGICVLENGSTRVELRGQEVIFAGLGDGHARRADPGKLMSTLPKDDNLVILLSHTPDTVAEMPAGSFGLGLSGHTHGGQLAVPLFQRRILRRFAKTAYDRGLYPVNDGVLFVTKGLGMVGYHARFRARPEVAILTLRAAA